MKKITFLFIGLSGFCSAVLAQVPAGGNYGQQPSAVQSEAIAQNGNGRITGVVMDSTTHQPVEFATIALTDPATGKPVDGTVCDAKGKFSITKVVPGNYKVIISFIGFESKSINISVSDKKEDHDLGTIIIKPTAEILKEVVVEGQKTLIEEKVDRTIYNAENDQTTRGGDATDVLKRVPMLSVDLDGNVSLRGTQNIKVLINNKPSTLAANSIADALKQIPADQIKTVEVITSPSAKYDAEGSGGIINIITKKNTMQGVTLNINSSAGTRGSNLGLNGTYRNKKMGFSIGGFGRANYNVHGSFSNQQLTTDNGTQSLTKQYADTRNNGLFGNYNLGWDYDIDEHNSLTSTVRFGVRNQNTYQDHLTTNTYRTDTLNSASVKDVNTVDLSGTLDASLNYTHTYQKPQQEFSLMTLYSRNNRTNDFVNNILDTADYTVIMGRLKNENKSYNQEFTIQADYQTPIGKTTLMELGGKNIMRTVKSDYKYLQASGSDGAYVPSNVQQANVFSYNQNVSAAYLAYTFSLWKSYTLKAGARYEYTTIRANFQNTQDVPSVSDIPAYGVFVPSVNFSKKLQGGNMVKIAFNRRIQRPSVQYLNPNLQASNPLNTTQGNPNLAPEYTNNYEASYNMFIKGTTLSFSAFARNTNNSIQSVRTVHGDTISTTYQNIGLENTFGGNVFANVNVGKLTLNGGIDTYYVILKNNVPDPLYNASNQGWVVSGRFMGSYNIKNGWGLQFFSFVRGRQVQLQGFQGGFRVYSLSVKKDLKNKKGSFGFGADNFFTPSFKIKSETTSPVIVQNSTNVLYNMSFKINFSYTIGKMSFDAPKKRRKSVNNDDLKDGGGGDMQDNSGGGGQGQQQQRPGAGMGAMTAPAGGQKPATQPVNPNAVPVPATVNAVGTWTYMVDSPQGGGGKIIIKKEGEAYSGTIISSRNNQETPLSSVSVSGNELSFNYTVNFGGNEVAITAKGTITGDDMAGTMNVGQYRSNPFTAKRSN